MVEHSPVCFKFIGAFGTALAYSYYILIFHIELLKVKEKKPLCNSCYIQLLLGWSCFPIKKESKKDLEGCTSLFILGSLDGKKSHSL